jgi:hypothetical protein
MFRRKFSLPPLAYSEKEELEVSPSSSELYFLLRFFGDRLTLFSSMLLF